MSPVQIPQRASSDFSRCEERNHLSERGARLTPGQETDAALKEMVERALRTDDVLRAIESYEMTVIVKDRVLYLSGHIVSTTSRSHIETAIQSVPGLVGIQNDLVLDDQLILEAAGSLSTLEHTYGCKFFTGASHGVVSLDGLVSAGHVKSLAEKQVSGHRNVRGVLNHVRVSGAEPDVPDGPFLQPAIGETIYFRDGISGAVTQVIINPDNRRVAAMIVRAQFANPQQELKSLNSGKALSAERLVVLPMDLVRYMTKVSGFLLINSAERDQYMEFDPAAFRMPDVDWSPPYPYCPSDVLFAVGKRPLEYQLREKGQPSPFIVTWVEAPLHRELLANDSLGG